MTRTSAATIVRAVESVTPIRFHGRVTAVVGLLVECMGLEGLVGVGARVAIQRANGTAVSCEVVGFRNERALLMPFGGLEGVGMGAIAEVIENEPLLYPDDSWLGRVVDAFGRPLDGKGPLAAGTIGLPLRGRPPRAHERNRIGAKVDLGVRAVNTFVTCCEGQRIGMFSASGVGKSVLLSMMARYASCDVAIIGLIGERGREVREFIEDQLGADGLARSIVVVATSDEAALVRRQAAYMTLACAEYFRDRGQNILCLMDSITRVAMAQREIGLTAGEPPTTKGYPPSVFSELPGLLERAGPGVGAGSITGLFSVLVEGDDHDEPIADAVRGILDGHLVMERGIAERGRFPAINVLRSISRTMPQCNNDEENRLVGEARRLMAVYSDMAEMIRLGAYRQGSDPEVDAAIAHQAALEAFLAQDLLERSTFAEGYAALGEILGGHET